MKIASNVKRGIETIAVVIIINNMRTDVSSKGAPKSGRKGIANMNKSRIVVFIYDVALNPFMNLRNATALGVVAGILFYFS
jgi:hypothetical protein